MADGSVDRTPDPTTAATPGRAGRREWLGLAVIALPCLLYSMDLTAVAAGVAIGVIFVRRQPDTTRWHPAVDW